MASLRADRVIFTGLVGELIAWINTPDNSLEKTLGLGFVEVAIDEWTVHTPRKVKLVTGTVLAWDAVHERSGKHPLGLACDLLVYIGGVYVADGGHPVWKLIDEWCRAKDPKFGLGISFHDSNHLSYGEAVAEPDRVDA